MDISLGMTTAAVDGESESERESEREEEGEREVELTLMTIINWIWAAHKALGWSRLDSSGLN